MNLLPFGEYKTSAGSWLLILEEHDDGYTRAHLQFRNENNACIKCSVIPYPILEGGKWYLVWKCDHCGGGKAELFKDKLCGSLKPYNPLKFDNFKI